MSLSRLRSWRPALAAAAAFSTAVLNLAAQPAASVSVAVQVPASMRTGPFTTQRNLTVPPNFAIAVHARVGGARFLATAPNGDILVSVPNAGAVKLVRANAGGDPTVTNFVSGLRNPHDVVFHTIGATTYVYIAESHQINRFVYTTGATQAGARQVVVANLPDASSPELQGAYGHQLKNIALGPDHSLYVSIASTSNADPSDTTSDPVRCAIYRYNADGTNRRLFARGLRNAEGLAFVPGTDHLWVAVNNRDNIAYPFHNDFDGDGSDDYGKVMPAYVDNHPPEEFTRVVDGANYGWPFANPNPDNGLDNMPFDFDVQNNPNWSRFPESTFTRISKGIQAHTAPLGLTFLQGTNAPAEYRNGVAIGLHGSWNRTRRVGYRVAYFPWNGTTQTPGTQMDLVRGWLDEGSQNYWGRPVDIAVGAQGELYISDDHSGTIYRMTRTSTPPPPGPVVSSLTLINTDTGQAIADPLPNNYTVNLTATPNVSVRANTTPSPTGSVRFAVSGAGTYTSLESVVPYCLAGDVNSRCNAWTPPAGPGTYTITATPYTAGSGGGTAGTALSRTLTLVRNGGPQVTSLSLHRVDNGQAISGFAPMADNAVIDLAQLPTRQITIVANTNPATVGSVRFALDANANYRLENVTPYAIAGDNGGLSQMIAWTLPPLGAHTVRATAFPQSGARGTAGPTLTRRFTLADSAARTTVISRREAVGEWMPDQAFVEGETTLPGDLRETDAEIDLSGAERAAPLAVYQAQRFANGASPQNALEYRFRELRPDVEYTVRLHFAELVHQEAGQRVMDVQAIDGEGVAQTMLSDFDIVAEAGAWRKALVKQFRVRSGRAGEVTVRLAPGRAGEPVVNGVELVPVE